MLTKKEKNSLKNVNVWKDSEYSGKYVEKDQSTYKPNICSDCGSGCGGCGGCMG